MKNTELFCFGFVDRAKERATLQKFLNRELSSNTMWVNGPSGVGKTFFIEKNVLEQKEKDDVIVYLNKIGEASATPYLTQFIKALGETSHISFAEFIRANYVSIFDVVRKVAVNILTNSTVNDFGVMDGGLDLTKQFLTANHKERHNLIKVVDRYLKYVSKKTKALIILDNFTLCDEESLEIFSTVLHTHQEDCNLQFILVTTEELLMKRLDILTLLSEKINVIKISMKPFSSSAYFFDILSDRFDLRQCSWEDIQRLHQVCSGLPQKLKIFLMTLYSQDGIDYQDEKASFAYDKLLKLLQQELINFDFDGLPKEQKYILQLVTEWGLPLELTMLQELSESIAKVDLSLQEFTGTVFRKALLELEGMGILEKVYTANSCQVKVKHDSIYYAVCQLLRENSVKSRFIHFSMLQFLDIHRDSFPQSDRKSLEAYHSYLAKDDSWCEINAAYGLKLAKEKQYIKAQKVLDRLSAYVQKLPVDQQLGIALNTYNAGEYEKADSILDLIPSENTTLQDQFMLQTTRCRTAMMRLEYTRALCAVNQLLDAVQELSTDQQLEALYLKEVALCLKPKGYVRAKRLFQKITQQHTPEDSPYWMERIYRTAMDYYRGNASKKYLQMAQALSRSLSDDEEWAKATHNLGFEHFRCGEYREAMSCFQDSRRILENIKPHETSYCLNNIAVIHMAEEEYDQALELLEEASFWNRSDYAVATIMGNRMICYHYTDQPEEELRLREKLLRFLKENPSADDKIYKKIYTNLAIADMNRGETEHAATLLKQCLPYLKTETAHSSARVKKLLYTLGDEAGQDVRLRCYNGYYYDLPFDPWVLTFGNE